MTLYQDCSSRHDLSKNMAARGVGGGGGLFPLYIYIENFNDLLVRNHWTDLNITLQECVFCNPLSRGCSSRHDSSKNMAPSGWGLFSLYIYIENFKKFLVRSHWTDFNITWQECFLSDLLPRLFKLSCFIKTWPLGGGAYFPYISI